MEKLKQEIYEYTITQLAELSNHSSDYLEDNDISDIHQELFNTSYYIIGTYAAKKWLGDNVFAAIDLIKEYEQDNFGEVSTNFSEPERVANMLAYVLGEEVLHKLPEDGEGHLDKEFILEEYTELSK